MNHLSRHPSTPPPLNPELATDAILVNAIWHNVQLYKNNCEGESFASFYAMAPFRPNIGEIIIAEDGTICIVKIVTFRVKPHASGFELDPVILAIVQNTEA